MAPPKSPKMTIKQEKANWMGASEDGAPAGWFAFVESTWFQGFVSLVIFCNAIMIGVEMDVELPYLWQFEFGFLAFFVLELYLRCCHHGWALLNTPANVLDVLIVVAGVIDMWIIPILSWLLGGNQLEHMDTLLFITQSLRLVRIVRLVRLVKLIRPLYSLALGITEAVQGLAWVVVFLALMLYAAAIVCTRLLGHGEADGLVGEPSGPRTEENREMFHSVVASMFVLFEMMSCWSLMKFVPLFRQLPVTRLLAVLFYILMAWGLLAVMTGVVSEKMIAVKDQLASEEQAKSVVAEKLYDLFKRADLDGSGSITREEFNSMLLCTELSRMLMDYTHATVEEMTELFDLFDHNKDGTVSIEEFVHGCCWLSDQVAPKSMIKLQEETSRKIRQIEKVLVAMINERFDRLIADLDEPLRKIRAAVVQVQRLEGALRTLHGDLKRATCRAEPDAVPDAVAELADVEQRLAQRIDALVEVISRADYSAPG